MLQNGELASVIAQHSYNELVSLLVDRLGDEAALQSKPGSRPNTPTPVPAAKADVLPADADARAEGILSFARPSSPINPKLLKEGDMVQHDHDLDRQPAGLELPSQAMQVRSARTTDCL